MNRSLMQVASVILGGAMDLTGMSAMASQGSKEDKVAITMHVYNYARIPAWRLARTQKRVADFFLSAGIQVRWAGHPLTSTNEPDPAGPIWNPGDLGLKIVSSFPKKAEGFRDSVFGFAAGTQVTIINDRTEEIAEVAEATYPEILAIVIAHELGHVLLGPNSHSDNGIMRPRFQADDFRQAQCKSLAFTPQQAEQMRHAIVMRISPGMNVPNRRTDGFIPFGGQEKK